MSFHRSKPFTNRRYCQVLQSHPHVPNRNYARIHELLQVQDALMNAGVRSFIIRFITRVVLGFTV